MERDFDLILDECIDRLKEGQSVEECIKLYPEFAKELEGALGAVGAVYTSSDAVGGDKAKAEGLIRLQQANRELDWEADKPERTIFERLFQEPKIWVPVSAAIVVILVIIGLAALASFNQHSNGTPSPFPIAANTGTPASTGILELRVTDAPNHDISAVNMTISSIEVHQEEADWETVISGSRSFELLELRGVEEILGSRELEAGHYTQIRLNVEEVLVTVDGAVQNAHLPSEQLKLTGAFDIQEGKVTILTMDFDAEKSLVITPADMIIFKPVVHLLVKAE
ncbi:MAG: DUF4382 domain-containing protein [Dehalococcoidia bacterium]